MAIQPENPSTWHSAMRHLPQSIRDRFRPGFLDGVMQTLDVPPSGAGLVIALSGAATALHALYDKWPRPGLESLADGVSEFHHALMESRETPARLRQLPDLEQVPPMYALMIAVVGGGRKLNLSRNITQVFGVVLMMALAGGKPLQRNRVLSLQSLYKWEGLRGQSSQQWEAFSNSICLDPKAVINAAQLAGQKAILDLAGWLSEQMSRAITIELPRVDYHATVAPDAGSPDPEPEGDFDEEDEQEVTESDTGIDTRSLVRWSYKHALRTTAAGSAGLCDYNMLKPGELRRVTGQLPKALAGDDVFEMKLALCAVISLATSLPIKLVLRISLTANGDIWLDCDAGEIVWSLDPLVERDPVPESLLAAGHRPDGLVRVPLPRMALRALALADRNEGRLFRALFAGQKFEDVEKAFGKFLRTSYEEGSRKPYSARYAYSLGAAIVEQTGDGVAAALACMDFRHIAPSELYYLCIAQARLYQALEKTWAWLGLGELSTGCPAGHVGSPLVPRREVYLAAVCGLAESILMLLEESRTASSFQHRVDVFDRLGPRVAALIVLLLGERGTRLERRTFASLYGHPDCVIIFDKETSSSGERPAAVTGTVKWLLGAYLAELRALSVSARKAGQDRLANRLRRMADLERPNSPVFIRAAADGKKSTSLSPVVAGDVADVLQHFGLHLNAGRHYLISVLSDPRYPVYVRRTLSGHGYKAGAAWHYASGIPMAQLLDELRNILMGFEADYGFPTEWTGTDRPAKHSLVKLGASAFRRRPDPAIRAFLRQDRRNAGRGSRPFSLVSTAILAHAEMLRERTVLHSDGLEPAALFLAMQVFLEGVSNEEECRDVWNSFANGEAFCVKRTLWIERAVSSGRRRVRSLLAPSLLTLHGYRLSVEKRSFDDARCALVKWAREIGPAISWPADDFAAMDVLFAIGEVLTLFELPPWIVTASTLCFGAASISLSSLVRLAARSPLIDAAPATTITRRRRQLERPGIGPLVKILNRLGSVKNQVGEDRARKNSLAEKLDTWRDNGVVMFPMVEAVQEYLYAEAEKLPTHGDPIEVATLADYIGSLSHALDQRLAHHPAEFEREEWIDLRNLDIDSAKTRGIDYDPSPIRRFARYWASIGSAVPPEIFAGESDGPVIRAPWSAASCFIWAHEWEQIRSQALALFPHGSIGHEVADVYLTVVREASHRASETNYARLADLDAELAHLVVQSSGFSHLKTGEDSRRVHPLSAEAAAKLDRLAKRLASISSRRRYFFFNDAPDKDPDFLELVAGLSRALRSVTGDPLARRHALRGIAECSMLVPNLDRFVESRLDLDYAEDFVETKGEKAWRAIVEVSSHAAHHSLTAVLVYLTIWPLVAHELRQRRLAALWPGNQFANWGGLEPGHLAVLRHRAKAAQKDALPLWRRLQKAVPVAPLASLSIAVGIAQSPGVVEPDEDETAFATEEQFARATWYVGLRLAGVPAVTAGDLSLATSAARLEEVVMQLRARSNVREGSKDLVHCMREKGFELASRIGTDPDLWRLRQAAIGVASVTRKQLATTQDYVDVLIGLRALLPKQWGIALLPEIEGLPGNLVPVLLRHEPTLLVKEPSRNKHARFRYSVSAGGSSGRSPRSQGMATQTLEILLRAGIALREGAHLKLSK